MFVGADDGVRIFFPFSHARCVYVKAKLVFSFSCQTLKLYLLFRNFKRFHVVTDDLQLLFQLEDLTVVRFWIQVQVKWWQRMTKCVSRWSDWINIECVGRKWARVFEISWPRQREHGFVIQITFSSLISSVLRALLHKRSSSSNLAILLQSGSFAADDAGRREIRVSRRGISRLDGLNRARLVVPDTCQNAKCNHES